MQFQPILLPVAALEFFRGKMEILFSSPLLLLSADRLSTIVTPPEGRSQNGKKSFCIDRNLSLKASQPAS